jgi:hypothetical protein
MSEKKIYVISHCLLNPEARVKGIKKPTPFQTADAFGNPKKNHSASLSRNALFGNRPPDEYKSEFGLNRFQKNLQQFVFAVCRYD